MLSELIVTVPFAPCVTAVTTGVPSNVSLPSTVVVTAVSSSVVAVSAAMSASGVTVTSITCVVVKPWSSVTVTVKLSLPL